ncbi:MAG: 2-C-methyl-D-erythritol 2,4-cyclodiphosphate synthase [Abditibacteriales bacterium]|nr:2-C-methyl-D-erythritol 2,4-cyclodiphosphate synthase [Abditibacteriales bacterium]MDW8365748.1 2-C-methyl-D-erythritol 2,4-cyclodiphosphate synthase [Abditibacteriales bacterium]
MMRIGIGYDLHRLAEGRQLIVGGVEIPFERGLVGHSDADVLVHALCDALLGAAGQPDIGRLFPDTDPTYRDANSLSLLRQVIVRVRAAGYAIVNVDSVLIAERPKFAPYIPAMCRKLSEVLQIPLESINIKAKTAERLGFLGAGEGIAAYVVALLERSVEPCKSS